MKYNRLNEIELYLSQKQYASIDDLLEKFNISLQTLRRDLKELQGRGIITKAVSYTHLAFSVSLSKMWIFDRSIAIER